MDYQTIDALRERNAAWRLLRVQHASLILSFLGGHFVEANHGATSASTLVEKLDDELYGLNPRDGEPLYPRSPQEYLDAWSAPEAGWLRRFYPTNSDEVHYDATPGFEKAYAWVAGLRGRAFVGTESRLHTVVDLLRQIVHGSDADADSRLEILRAQRAELDRQIADVEAGHVDVLTDTAVRDRYQQFAGTARELLADFREVEENFRPLDRAAREQIAGWDGSKGAMLSELVSRRTDINASDQGASFQAFYDFLLSETRQDELTELLARVQQLSSVDADPRLRTVHHDWSDAAERTQQTVRQISEQLRRFLDDQVWLENRRVLELVRRIEGAALAVRDHPPADGLQVDLPGIALALPFERPLYDARPAAAVDSMPGPSEAADLDVSALLSQRFVDHARLAGNIRSILPTRSTALLTDILQMYPVEQGAAEIVGYLSLTDEDLVVELDETDETLIDYLDPDGRHRRARLPRTTVSRR